MAGSGQSPSAREVVQTYQVQISQSHYDILVAEGRIPTSGVTLSQVQKAIVVKEEEGETTSSEKTIGPSLGDNQVGTTRIVNGENRSTGSAVGIGQWIGTFSGSVDVFATGSTLASYHFTHFDGAFSSSLFQVGNLGSGVQYGKVYIGAPADFPLTESLGTAPNGKSCITKPFSGSFIANGGLHTEQSGSASGSLIVGSITSSNTFIPGGEYSAKWISGSFPGGNFTTSSTLTQEDFNNVSKSKFEGVICVATGGFTSTTNFMTSNSGSASTTFHHSKIFGFPQTSQTSSTAVGDKQLSATVESAFAGGKVLLAGTFRNSGSLKDNNSSGGLVTGLVGGSIFGIAPSGSEGTVGFRLISGSIESLTDGGFVNRGPGQPYINETAQANYFKAGGRKITVIGAQDKFQKKKRKEALTANSSPRG